MQNFRSPKFCVCHFFFILFLKESTSLITFVYHINLIDELQFDKHFFCTFFRNDFSLTRESFNFSQNANIKSMWIMSRVFWSYPLVLECNFRMWIFIGEKIKTVIEWSYSVTVLIKYKFGLKMFQTSWLLKCTAFHVVIWYRNTFECLDLSLERFSGYIYMY